MKISLRSSLVLLALLATVSTASAQTTWTIEPVLKRLDTNDAELPSGQVDVTNSDTLRIGVYFELTKSSASNVEVGFENVNGNVYFTGALSNASLSTVVASLPLAGTRPAGDSPSAETDAGFYRRWSREQIYTGDNVFTYASSPPNRRWGFAFDEGLVSRPLNPSTLQPVPGPYKGIYCQASELTCDIFLGVLVVPLSNLASTAVGALSMKIAGTTLADAITVAATDFSGTVNVNESNTISYFVCPSTGCPVTATFASNAYSVEEGDMVDLTVTLSEAYSGSITIPIAARTSGTGAGDAPTTAYTLPSPSSVTFAAGATTQTFQVTADDNTADSTAAEPPQATQTLVLDFGALPGTVVAGGTTSTTVTITDDDFPAATVAFGAASYAATEGGSAAQVAVTLTAPASPNTLEREVVVPITTTLAGGASNADFSGVQTTLTFATTTQGASTQTITVTATDDTDGTCGTCSGVSDINESITLGFGSLPKDMTAGAQSTTSVSLQDNDSDRVDLAVNVSSLSEGDSATNVTVTGTLRVNSVSALASAIEVPLATSGSATSGSGNDYTITADTLTFAVGATSGAEVTRTLSVTPNDDSVVENVETIVITGTPAGILSGVTDAAPINLADNDTATVSIAAPAAGVSEGTDGAGQSDTASAAFTATLSAQVATAVTVAWSAGTDGASGTEDADPDSDLVAKSGSIVFAANSAAMTAQTISVSIENDEDSEGDEVFRVTLGAITGAPPARGGPPPVPPVTVHGSNGFADATILKNDPLTVALEAPPKLLEGRVAQYTLRVLDGTSTQPVVATVTAAVVSQLGSASTASTGCPANADICQRDGTAFPGGGVPVTIPAGQATGTFELRIADDGRGDENEEVTVTISNVQGGRISTTNTDGITPAPVSPAQPGGPVSVATTSISEALAVSVGPLDDEARTKEEGGTFTIPVLVDDQPESGDTLTVRYELVPGADPVPGAEPLPVYEQAVAADYSDESGGSVTIGAEHCDAGANPDGGCRTSITVEASEDNLSEVDETFWVRLTGVTVNSSRPNAREAVVADDADDAKLTIAANDPVVVAWEPPPFLREGRLATVAIRVTGVDDAPVVSTAPIVLDVHVCFPTCSGGESALAAASAGSSAPAPASHGGPEDAVLIDGDMRLPIPMGGLMHRTTIPAGAMGKDLLIDVHRDEEDDDDEQIGLWFTNVAGGRGVDRTVAGEEPPADPDGIMFSGEVPQNLGSVEPLQIKQVFLVAINTEGAEALLAVDEGGEFRIPVEVDDALDEGVTLTVRYTVAPDTESRGAGAGDYSDPAEGSVLITGPGATPGTLIRIAAVDDNLSEAREAFTVTLTGVDSSNQDLVAAELDEPRKTTTVMIGASDPLTVSFTGPEEARENTTATYTVSLGGGVSTADVVVPIVLNPEAPGRGALPAADAADVDDLPAEVTVPSGQPSRTFDLGIVREPGSAREGKEYLVLELGELTGGGGGGLVASRDADSVGTVITEVNLEERGKAMKYTLAAFGRTLASGMVEAIEGRVAASRSPGGSQMTLAGEDLSLSAFGLEGEDADAEAEAAAEALRKMERLLGLSTDDAGGMSLDPVSSRELLTGSSFDLSLHGERDRAGSWSAWGHGSAARFEGEPENRFSMKGDVLSGYVGLDSRVREDMLAGVALNLSTGDTDYSFTEGTKGTIDTTLTSVHPYVHWSPVPSVGLWATLGIGQGDATLDDGDSEPVTTDVRMRMGATGARAELGEWQSIDWAMKADAFLVRLESEEREDLLPAVEADAHRLRWLLEGSRSVELASGAGLTGTFELGTRLDGGDGDEGGGAEVGGGVTYGHPETGLDLSARGRAVLSHTASGFKEWGLGFSAAYDPGVPGRGLHMSVEPAWGNAASGMNSLWEETARSAKVSETDSDDEARRADPDMALAAEAGYGLGLMNERGLLTPFGALNLSNEHSGVRLGTRLSLEARRDTDLDLSVYGEREGSSTDADAAQYSMVFDSRVGRGLWEGAGSAEVFSKLAVGDREDYEVGVRIRLRF